MGMFSYKITRDFGFAPNPFHGYCTLGTCKPQIRKAAGFGDLIVGCGSKKNGLVGRMIYVMRVSGTLTFDDYWNDARFLAKRPNFKSGTAFAYGDNIYRPDGSSWVQERSHHSHEDGSLNTLNSDRDTSVDAVLWSDDYVYWGRDAIEIPAKFRNFNGDDLYPNTRDRRAHFEDDFIAAVDAWFTALPDRGRRGRPGAWK